jgi:hypothetical protein
MSGDDLSRQFKALHDAWGDAIANKNYDWFERHFADNFHGTAVPWPTLFVDKAMMIELDKNIETMEVEWVELTAHQYGDMVVTRGVVEYHKEEFKAGATIADGMPTGDELSALVNGKQALYINGWRHNGTDWQLFDHHMVGVIDKPTA